MVEMTSEFMTFRHKILIYLHAFYSYIGLVQTNVC